MPIEIRLPRLGWSMEEGTFLGWRKEPGAKVAVGEALFELEGEKAAQDIESVDAGILFVHNEAPTPGTVLAVGSLLGYLLQPGESTPSGENTPSNGSIQSGGSHPDALQASSIAEVSTISVAGPSARRLARTLDVDLSEVVGTGKRGRIVREDVETAATKQTTSTPKISPRAKRVAEKLRVDWKSLHGTGSSGRIREADVRAAYELVDLSSSVSGQFNHSKHGLASQPSADQFELVSLSPRRKLIAERLRTSRDRTTPVTLTTSMDVTNLVALRDQFKAASSTRTDSPVPSYSDIIACLVASQLRVHRKLAATWDRSNLNLHLPKDDSIHIGIAVDTAEGLVVPVVSDVGSKSLLDVSRETKVLIDRARKGTLKAVEMQGGCFSISNLGAFGIDAFTPIINYPEVAILGLGAIRSQLRLDRNGSAVSFESMVLSLTFDHAAMDGAPAAAFLRDLAFAMTSPAAHLLLK